VESQVQTALLATRAEVAALEERCAEVSRATEQSDGQMAELAARLAALQALREDAERQFAALREDYRAIVGTHTSVVDVAGGDPFDDARFRTCLGQMIDRSWEPPALRANAEELDGLRKALAEVHAAIAALEAE
jgi:septal ring factor EnvC (AmiA/AmiB activator)